jgi:hypothetical protein
MMIYLDILLGVIFMILLALSVSGAMGVVNAIAGELVDLGPIGHAIIYAANLLVLAALVAVIYVYGVEPGRHPWNPKWDTGKVTITGDYDKYNLRDRNAIVPKTGEKVGDRSGRYPARNPAVVSQKRY